MLLERVTLASFDVGEPAHGQHFMAPATPLQPRLWRRSSEPKHMAPASLYNHSPIFYIELVRQPSDQKCEPRVAKVATSGSHIQTLRKYRPKRLTAPEIRRYLHLSIFLRHGSTAKVGSSDPPGGGHAWERSLDSFFYEIFL